MPIEVVNLLTHCRIRLLTISFLKMGERGKESGIDIYIHIRNVWSSLRSWIDRAMYDQPFLLEKFIYVKLFVLEEQRTVWSGKSAAIARYRAYNLANHEKNLSFTFSFHSILCNLDIWKLLFLRFLYRKLYQDLHFFVSEVQQLCSCIIDEWFRYVHATL